MTPFALAAATAVVRAVDDSTVTPGVLGFVVVALLGVATWLLIRSMTRQMKKIDIPPEGTPTRPDGTDQPAPENGDERAPGEPGSAQR